MLVIELPLAYNAREGLLAYLYLNLVAQRGLPGIDKSQADTLVCGYGMITSGYLADGLPLAKHRIAVAWDGLVTKLYAYKLAAHALSLLACQCLAADEVGLVQLYEHGKAGHDGRYVGRQFIAIKRQSHLET